MLLRSLRQTVIVLAAAACALACLFSYQLSSPSEADAGAYGFCENAVLSPYQGCAGPATTMYQVYGYGDNASVCVLSSAAPSTERCSGGPNQGVYSATFEFEVGAAYIRNHAGVSNRVHGVYLTH